MKENIKNYFGYALVFGVVVVALSAWSYVRSYGTSIQPSSFRSFAVVGEGKVVAVPDVAKFSFSVITEGGKDLATLQKENTEKMNKAVEFVKNQGVKEADVKTENFNVSPRYQYSNCGYNINGGVCPPPAIVGYTVSQTVSVKARDFSKVGDILAGVVGAGANNVSELNFTIDDQSVLQNKARAEAINKAKATAEAVANAGGFSLGRLLGIDEYNNAPMLYAYGRGGGMMTLDEEEKTVAPTIEAGSQDVVVNVTLRYEIK